jgi:quercetin dioxygenase-like cupin family protein
MHELAVRVAASVCILNARTACCGPIRRRIAGNQGEEMMRSLPVLAIVLLAGCAATTEPQSTGAAQPARAMLSAPPTQNHGVSVKLLSTLDMAYVVGAPGYQLRARAVTIQPGGHVAAHAHDDRVTQEYVAQGTVVEIRNGVAVQHAAGSMVQGIKGVYHWWENQGSVPVVLIPVDVAKP